MTTARDETTSPPSQVTVQRVQTGVRVEKRMLKVLKALAEYFDISLGDLLEGIVLHAFEGKSPFEADAQQRIETLKEIYDMDYDVRASHRLVEQPPYLDRAESDETSLSTPTRVAVISLWAENVPAAVHFYRDVIGLQLLPSHSHHGKRPHFDLDGTYVIILQGKPVPAQDAEPAHFPLVAFAVQDLESAVERLRAHRVELPQGVQEGVDSRWVVFRDPAGNLVELVEFGGQ
jgi:catechol 2,3-dioxygenase-like lactoylglutathione lyase family enzyme